MRYSRARFNCHLPLTCLMSESLPHIMN